MSKWQRAGCSAGGRLCPMEPSSRASRSGARRASTRKAEALGWGMGVDGAGVARWRRPGARWGAGAALSSGVVACDELREVLTCVAGVFGLGEQNLTSTAAGRRQGDAGVVVGVPVLRWCSCMSWRVSLWYGFRAAAAELLAALGHCSRYCPAAAGRPNKSVIGQRLAKYRVQDSSVKSFARLGMQYAESGVACPHDVALGAC